MNTLTYYVGDHSCLYWETEKTSIEEAIEELFNVMEQNNIGNDLISSSVTLEDEDGNIIDEN